MYVISRRLSHPNIVRLMAAAHTENTFLLANEYIHGTTLDNVLHSDNVCVKVSLFQHVTFVKKGRFCLYLQHSCCSLKTEKNKNQLFSKYIKCLKRYNGQLNNSNCNSKLCLGGVHYMGTVMWRLFHLNTYKETHNLWFKQGSLRRSYRSQN